MTNILRNASIRNSDFCRFDTNEGYSVTWDVDDEFFGYTVFTGLTARLAANSSYFFVSTESQCSITSGSDIVSIDAGRHTQLKIGMRLNPGTFHSPPTQARIDFRTAEDTDWDPEKQVVFSVTPDNSYQEYLLDMSLNMKWQGNIVRLRLWPFIDGDSGQHIFVKYIKAVSTAFYSCATRFRSPGCSHYALYSHPCPFRGSAASVTGLPVADRLSIVRGTNDTLLINIDSYGYQSVVLDPGSDISLQEIAQDIQSKLNLTGVGSYAYATCSVVDAAFVISGGAPSADSSVVLSPLSSAGVDLGFFSEGVFVGQTSAGVDPASRYEPEAAYRLDAKDIDDIYKQDDDSDSLSFCVQATRYVPQGGYIGYADTARDTSFYFYGKTLIDYNNPITDNGVVVKAFYSGAANKNSEFRVYRQRLDGSLVLVGAQNVGSLTDANTGKLFEIDCMIRVQKGDLLALFDAAVHTGIDTEQPSFSYYLYDGDLQASSEPLRLYGDGERGVPLFCRGSEKANKAAILLDFPYEVPVESLFFRASEEVRSESLPLTRLLSGGLNGGPYITGYTGYGLDGTKAPGWTGLSYLTDGSKLDVNGLSSSAYPLWWGSFSQSNYDYTEAGLILDFAPNTNALFDIDRVVVYFAAPKNIKDFSVDYPFACNESDTIKAWAPVTSVFRSVSIDGVEAASDRYLYNNPAFITALNYHEEYSALGYRTIDLGFVPVRARSIRFRGYLERNSDYYSDQLSAFPIYLDPRIQEIEVFATTTPVASIGDNFEVFSSSNGYDFLQHQDKDILSSTDLRFTIGYPVRTLKVIVNAVSTVSIRKLYAFLSHDSTFVRSSSLDNQVVINAPINGEGQVSEGVTVVNESGETSDYYVDITGEDHKSNSCILFNRADSDDSIQQSVVGAGGILYKRPNFTFRLGNVAKGAPAYTMDPNFLVDCPCYISYDSGAGWEALGNRVVNGNKLDYVDNISSLYLEHTFVYVAVDCKKQYDFTSVVPVKGPTGSGDPGWDTEVWYSSADVADPATIPLSGAGAWVLGYPTGARWLKVRAPATFSGPGSNYRSLAYLRVFLEIHSSLNYSHRFPWVAEPRLVNGISGSTSYSPEAFSSGGGSYYCVDLSGYFDIARVLVGPYACEDAPDFNSCTMLDVNRSNPNIAFSGSVTDDPSKVRWRAFGGTPTGRDRWVLYRGSLCDEMAVFINDDQGLTKPLYSLPQLWSARLGVVQEDTSDYCNIAGSSMSLVYPTSRLGASETFKLSTPLGFDNNLAPRDSLGLCLFVSDISQVDPDYGYFKLSRYTSETLTFNNQLCTADPDNFYVWDFKDFSATLVNGWNVLLLPFTDNHRVGDPRLTTNLSNTTLSTKRRSRIGEFAFVFRGLPTQTEDILVKLDGLEILRYYFGAGRFGDGIYLAESDYLKFPLNGFNPVSGCLEFFISPDWSKSVGCNACTDVRDHCIFKLLNSFGFLIELVMTNAGLRVLFSNGSVTLTSLDDALGTLVAGYPSKVSFVWDINDPASIFELYIDGVLSSSYSRSSLQGVFDTAGHTGVYLLFGGMAWAGLSTKEASGFDGVLDNIRVYNYPRRPTPVDTDEPETVFRARDMIELSSDNSVFLGYNNRTSGLPLIYRGVSTGDSFRFYCRTVSSGVDLGAQRDRRAFVEISRSPTVGS